MEERKILSGIDEVKVYSDPYRLEILEVFYKADKPLTVKQVASSMDQTPAKVHYHVKKMEKANLLELIYTKEVNGIIAKYYEPTARIFIVDGNYNKENSLVIRNNLERVVVQEFDNAKENFLEGLRTCEDNKTFTGTLGSEKIYLTDDEFQEIKNMIQEFCNDKKYFIEDKNNKKKYQYLFSIMDIDNLK